MNVPIKLNTKAAYMCKFHDYTTADSENRSQEDQEEHDGRYLHHHGWHHCLNIEDRYKGSHK